MNHDDDVRRSLERIAAEAGYGTVDPTPVLHRAYRRLARTTSVMGLAAVTLAVAIATAGPGLFHAVPEPAPAVAGAATAATTPQVLRITCLGDGRAHLQAATVARQSDGLHVAIVQDHAGRGSRVYMRVSGWMMSVGTSDPDGTRFRVIPSIDGSVRHIGIGCFESSTVRSGSFHRLTIVGP